MLDPYSALCQCQLMVWAAQQTMACMPCCHLGLGSVLSLVVGGPPVVPALAPLLRARLLCGSQGRSMGLVWVQVRARWQTRIETHLGTIVWEAWAPLATAAAEATSQQPPRRISGTGRPAMAMAHTQRRAPAGRAALAALMTTRVSHLAHHVLLFNCLCSVAHRALPPQACRND